MNQKTSSSPFPQCRLHLSPGTHICLDRSCLLKVLCNKCLGNHHSEHTIVSINEAIGNMKKETGNYNQYQEKILTLLQKFRISVVSEIESYKAKILEKIDGLIRSVELEFKSSKRHMRE
mgnify:CR=1 FL=1